MTPKQALLILYAHRYVAVIVFVIVAIAGVAFTLRVPKTYVVSSDLLVDSRVDPIAGAVLTANNYIATQIAILQSDRVALDVAKRMHLEQDPKFVNVWQASTLGKIPLENFYAEPLRTSNVIRLTFEGPDAKFATAVVNNYAQAYLDLTVNLRVEPVKQYSEWFEDRLKTLRADVEQKQNKLSEYQREHGIVGSDQRADVESQRLDALMAQLVAVQGENISINSREKASGDEMSPDVQASLVVQGLRQELDKTESQLSELSVTLGPNHPQRQQLEQHVAEIKQQINQEMNRVAGSTGVAKKRANLRESSLRAEIAAQKERVLSLRAQRDEVAVLVQDVEGAKRIYDSVLQRTNQLNLEKQTDQANVSVLSPAVEPTAPSKPDVLKYLLASFVGAIGAGCAAALGLEMLSRKVRVTEDMMVDDVPVLGILETRDGSSYTLKERIDLFKKFFSRRKLRKQREEKIASSRLGGLT